MNKLTVLRTLAVAFVAVLSLAAKPETLGSTEGTQFAPTTETKTVTPSVREPAIHQLDEVRIVVSLSQPAPKQVTKVTHGCHTRSLVQGSGTVKVCD